MARLNKTREVARGVLRLLVAGAYSPGQQIPAERDMARRSGTSRVTVRRAYAELQAAGILERRQGHGTRISTVLRGHTERIRQVALISGEIGPFGLAFLRALEAAVAGIDALLVLKASGDSPDRQEEAAIAVAANGIRNLVIWPSGSVRRWEIFERLRIMGTNMVFFDRARPGRVADFVGLDNADAMRQILNHAMAEGCRSLCFFGHHGAVADSEQERLKTFQRWCSRQGVPHACFSAPWRSDPGEALLQVREYGRKSRRRTGVVCVNDQLAMVATSMIDASLPLYGIDGRREAVAMGITTLAQPLARMAQVALELLREQQSKGAEWRAREVRCRGRLLVAKLPVGGNRSRGDPPSMHSGDRRPGRAR